MSSYQKRRISVQTYKFPKWIFFPSFPSSFSSFLRIFFFFFPSCRLGSTTFYYYFFPSPLTQFHPLILYGIGNSRKNGEQQCYVENT